MDPNKVQKKEERRPRKRICHKGRPIIIDYCNLFYRNLFKLDRSINYNNFISIVPQCIDNQYFCPTLVYPRNQSEQLTPNQYYQIQQQIQQPQIIEQPQNQGYQNECLYEQQRYYHDQQQNYFEFQHNLYEEEEKNKIVKCNESQTLYNEGPNFYQEKLQPLYIGQEKIYFEQHHDNQQNENKQHQPTREEKYLNEKIEEYIPQPFDIIGKGNFPSIIHKGNHIEIVRKPR